MTPLGAALCCEATRFATDTHGPCFVNPAGTQPATAKKTPSVSYSGPKASRNTADVPCPVRPLLRRLRFPLPFLPEVEAVPVHEATKLQPMADRGKRNAQAASTKTSCKTGGSPAAPG